MKHFVSYTLPAIVFFLFAFITGSQRSLVWAMISFLSFFTLGVMMLIAGSKKKKEQMDEEK